MSYTRVIPRDLFNEAKLLKCLGRLSLMLHDGMGSVSQQLTLDLINPEQGFQIERDDSSGDISCTNLRLQAVGRPVQLWTPLNSQAPHPLHARIGDAEDDVPVLADDGTWHEEFIAAVWALTA